MKKLFGFLIAVILVSIMLPSFNVSAAQAVSKEEIKNRADRYVQALGLTGNSCTYFWNKNVRNNDLSLQNDLDAFRAGGSVSNLTNHLTNKKCNATKDNHDNNKGTCTSNIFEGRAQCRGFTRYFMYYLFGQKLSTAASYTTYTSANASWESIGGVQLGDYVDITPFNHPFIYYSGRGSSYVTAIHANGLSTKYPCGIIFGNVYKPNDVYCTEDDIKTYYQQGKVKIIRYNNIVTCSHTYTFVNDNSVICSKCKASYTVPAPSGGNAYMDISSVNSNGVALSHKTPYGDATLTTKYKKGQTVQVVGSVKNAFDNVWYKLSTGEWINDKYLGTHVHRRVKSGFCTLCTENINVVRMNPTTIRVKSGNSSVPVHFAPYGASMIYKRSLSSITVNAKAVNGYGNVWYRLTDGSWIFSDYLTTPLTTGIVKVNGNLALNNAAAPSPSQSNEIAAIPNGTLVYIYTGETSGSWYSVRYNDKVGFVYKSYVTVADGSKQVEAPPSNPEPSTDDEASSVPPSENTSNDNNTNNNVYIYYPTDSTYLAKFSIGETNATVVANIIKPSGSKVTACGLMLYDAQGNLIKEHTEQISNVGNSTKSFHSWYDITAELGITLTPNTSYLYKFFTVVDGIKYTGSQYGFTTKASASATTQEPTTEPKPEPEPEPEPETTDKTPESYKLTFDANGGTCTTEYKTITFDTAIGSLPIPVRDGYTFDGWYTQATGGNPINEQMRYNAPFDVTVYAHWTANEYNLIFDANGGKSDSKYKTITFDTAIGSLPTPVRDGYTFDGWYTQATGGNPINEQMRYNAPFDVTVYAHWSKTEKNPIDSMSDVSKSKWYFDAVEYVVGKGIMNGYSNNKFAPDDYLSRAMLVQILYNYSNKPAVSANNAFNDVKSTDWYFDAVQWGKSNNIVSGYGNNYNPNNHITRQEVAQILYNYAGKPKTSGRISQFSDAKNVSSWAEDAMKWAVSNGIINGKNGKLDPTGNATRAEAAQMLTNFIKAYK